MLAYAGNVKAAADHALRVQAQANEAQGILNYVSELTKNASAEDKADMEKFASAVWEPISKITDPIKRAAAMQGAMDGAAMLDGGEGGAPGTIPGGEAGPATIEQVAQLLDAMVSAQEVDPQAAAQALKLLADGMQGGGAPADAGAAAGAPADAAAAAPDAGAGAPPPEAGGAEGAAAMPPEAGAEDGLPPEMKAASALAKTVPAKEKGIEAAK